MPTALQHSITVPGVVLSWILPSREPQIATTKFWGVKGESSIFGQAGGRTLDIPVVVYDAGQFPGRPQLAAWLNNVVGRDEVGKTATLTVSSAAGHPPFENTRFEAVFVLEGPKIDEVGSLGGGAFAICRFIFRQHW